MESLKTIFDHYKFSAEDVERLKSILPVFEDHVDDCVTFMHTRLRHLGNKETTESLVRHPLLANYHREWLLDMFRGVYDKNYYNHLKHIGKVHMREDILPHYVSVSMYEVRSYLMDLLSERIEDRDRRTLLKESMNKIIDINLDIITNSYVEEEIQSLSATYKVKTALVTFAEKFSGAMNLVLILSLIVITLGVLGLFVSDFLDLIRGDMSHGIIATLGSLLILWVMIELMNTEIAHLKGGKFNISVFIGVALVTFIRDLMIAALKHEESTKGFSLIGVMIGVILVLGIVYWLVVKTESKNR
jgi:uncharacterized membrane protein (DUF373 family)